VRRRSPRARLRRLRRVGYRVLRRLEYDLWRRLPLRRDLAAFAAYWNRGYACNPRAIYEQLRESAPQVHGVWVVRPGVTMPPDVDHVVAGSRAYYRLMARAAFFVNNVGFPDHVRKRRGMTVLMTHHGTPLKYMGLDQLDDSVEPQQLARRFARWARWDYSLSSNPHSTQVWKRVYPGRYTTLEFGYPRNDRLVQASSSDVEQIRADLGLPADGRTLLYAPTHREYEPEFRQILDIGKLAAALGESWTILSRAHYFNSDHPEAAAHGHAGVIDVTGHPTVEELYLAADILVTDYSSAMFDYALLDRPIVIFAPDWETYQVRRGTYFDLMSTAPGAVCRTPEELADVLSSGAFAAADADQARRRFRETFCPWDDGRAAERVVRRVFLGEHG
jgi:CDP-glycerol glycerophosphotransferase